MEKFTNGRQAMGKFADLYGKKTFQQLLRYEELVRRFKKKYKSKFCYLASSSGRVELIGNHTDHNGGKVLGCTVDADIVAAFLPNDTNKVCLEGNNYRRINFDVADIFNVESGSTGMVKGVLAGLANRGYKVGGFDAVVNSTLPSGAGMSSSAAFQLLVATIQNHLYNDGKISEKTLAEVGQFAENVYFKKPCGLLDQGVIAVGGLVAIDFSHGFCATRVQNNLASLNLVVVNTGKSHSTLTEHYAAIPQEMKDVARFFGKERLADVDEQTFWENFAQAQRATSSRAVLRAKHFFEENRRVEMAVQAVQEGNNAQLISLLNASGQSSEHNLQNCRVGDDSTIADAVAFAHTVCPHCAARVHGGGFQGTVLAVVENSDVGIFTEEMSKRYGKNNVKLLKVRKRGATVL
ncbi:MAG: galactokinase [Candidatus Fimimonas sp.]